MDCLKPRHPDKPAEPCRLQKYLALCGLGSRRACESLIEAGKVTVDGRVVERQGVCIDPTSTEVRVSGNVVRPADKLYVAVNKPPGIITTCRDPHRRETVTGLLSDVDVPLYPVGRLDKDSEGLVLMTNDGDLTHSLTHPRHHVPKIYKVWSEKLLTAKDMACMTRGVESDGQLLRAAEVSLHRAGKQNNCYRVVLHEGRKRQIRRMFQTCGAGISRLRREQIGPMKLGALPQGEWRFLSESEVLALKRTGGARSKRREGKRRE